MQEEQMVGFVHTTKDLLEPGQPRKRLLCDHQIVLRMQLPNLLGVVLFSAILITVISNMKVIDHLHRNV